MPSKVSTTPPDTDSVPALKKSVDTPPKNAVSISTVQTYKKCQRLAYYRSVLGVVPAGPEKAYFGIGRVLHAIFDDILTTQNFAPAHWLVQAEKKYKGQFEPKDYASIPKLIPGMCDFLHAEQWKPVEIEKSVVVPPLYAINDVVVTNKRKAMVLCDLKSSSGEPVIEAMLLDPQFVLLTYLAKIRKLPIQTVGVLHLNKRSGAVTFCPVTPEDSLVWEVLDDLNAVAEAYLRKRAVVTNDKTEDPWSIFPMSSGMYAACVGTFGELCPYIGLCLERDTVKRRTMIDTLYIQRENRR